MPKEAKQLLPKKYGWYSAKADTNSKHYDYLTLEGKVVKVTFVHDKRPPKGIKPGDKHQPKPYNWEDTRYVGPVTEFVRTCIMNPMEACPCWGYTPENIFGDYG
jgi:hypothetical protein